MIIPVTGFYDSPLPDIAFLSFVRANHFFLKLLFRSLHGKLCPPAGKLSMKKKTENEKIMFQSITRTRSDVLCFILIP